MIYNMHVDEKYFQKIKAGKKTIEMRLNYPERKNLNTADIIIFASTQTEEKIKTMVASRYEFKSFEELYEAFPHTELGYDSDTEGDPSDMLEHYTKENIKKFGVLALKIALL